MNTDKTTSWVGLAVAIGTAAVDFYATANADGSIGWANPMFYIGMGIAILIAVQGWFTNKPSDPSV